MRTSVFLLFAFVFNFSLLACPEGGSPHKNPDGSIGGIVGKNATVASGAFVSSSAKVCSFATVNSTSKVLDHSQISGHAIIGPFVIVRGNAKITDQAEVKGTSQSPTVISENAFIKGKSKISKGSVISGHSVLEGSPEVIMTKVRGTSKVCKNYKIVSEDINNSNYFCPKELESESRSQVSVVGLKANVVNLPRNRVKLRLSLDRFALDKNTVSFQINGAPIQDDKFQLEPDYLEFDPSELFQDGENSISIIAKDNFGKVTSLPETVFYYASREHSVLVNNGQSKIAVLAVVKENNKYIELESKINGNEIILPALNKSSEVKLFVGSQSSIYANSFEASSLPESIEMEQVPEALGLQNLDFSEGTNGWHINHPESTELKEEEGKSFLRLYSKTEEPVLVARQFQLTKSQPKIQFAFSTSALSGPGGEILSRGMDVFHYSKTLNKIYVSDFSPEFLEANSPQTGGVREVKGLADSYSIQTKENEQIISGVVVYGDLFKSKIQSDSQTDLKALVPSFTTFFKLLSVNSYNHTMDEQGEKVAYPFILSGHGCGLDYEIIPEHGIEFKLDNSFNFLSVGSINTIFHPTEGYQNRIFGNLKIEGLKKKDIEKIEFEIIQGNDNPETVKLSNCWQSEFEKMGDDDEVHFEQKQSLAHYLFQIDSLVLKNFRPNFKYPIAIYPKITHKNGLVFRVKDFVARNPKESKYEVKFQRPLAWLNLPSQFYELGSVDYYHHASVGMSRVGGDKWMRYELVDEVNEIGQRTLGWIVNDASKANGGSFDKPHGATHTDGVDIDIKFRNINGVKLDLENPKVDPAITLSEAQWRVGEAIESFLYSIRGQFKKIKDIYITVTPQRGQGKTVIPKNRYIAERFHATCREGRFIDLVDPARNRGTLLRSVPNHSDHLHIRYNYPDIDEGIVEPKLPKLKDLKDLVFEITQDKRLKIQFENPDGETSLLWKVSNRSSYTKDVTVYDFGSSSAVENYSFPSYTDSAEVLVVDLVFANKNGMGCVAKKIALTHETMCPSGEKFRLKEGEDGYLLAVSLNSLTSDGVTGTGSVCGDSNLQGEVRINGSVSNVHALAQASAPINLRDVHGEPRVNIVSHAPLRMIGFRGYLNSVTTGNLKAVGTGKLTFETQENGSHGINLVIHLNGELNLNEVKMANMSGDTIVEGSHSFNNYHEVYAKGAVFRGTGTYTGTGKNNPYSRLVFESFRINGNASVSGPAYINSLSGSIYSSLNLYVNNIDDHYISVKTGGGAVSISGKASVDIDSEGFTMTHSCDYGVGVLITGAPNNFSLNPDGDNFSTYHCNFTGAGMICQEPRTPCRKPQEE